MRTGNKKLTKCMATFGLTVALALQGICPWDMANTVHAAGTEAGSPAPAADSASNSRIEALLTDYKPHINEVTDPYSGFTHPGVGVTKETLDNVQAQVRAGAEPWKSYFETMILDDGSISGRDVGPKRNGGPFNNNTFNNNNDGSRAYAQALMYYITGDNAYRRNAMRIIRAYEDIDPESLEYFNDACIHMGIPTNRICIAAEILRYSSYQVTDGYTEEELAWTEEDTEKFISNFLSPEVEVFQYSPDRFMNQHLYTTIGAMSAYLFMDDAESYEKAVEWFTVNKNGRDQGQNGSIKRLFREIATVDAVGAKEGSGTPLDKPVIQHVEMGRDQAHGCGDLTNSAILSRLMLSQGTKVDPQDGTVSTDADAVDCFTFLDDRMVKAADFFFQYMLGYDTEWVPVPFAIDTDGTIKDSYAAFAASYRGRYTTINFWDFYTYYAYNRGMTAEQLQEKYPYFYEGYGMKTYCAWGNNDGGGDFWVFLPAAAAGDTSFVPKASEAHVIQVENRSSIVSAHTQSGVRSDGDGTGYVHLDKADGESRVAMNSAGIGSDVFLFRVRTDGIAKLTMSSSPESGIYLPDTKGQWMYVPYPKDSSEGFGDMYYFSVTNIEGSYTDVDAIYTSPKASNLDAVTFESGREEYNLATYIGAPFAVTLGAVNVLENPVRYTGINLPEGVTVDENTGKVTWSPDVAGEYTFYVAAAAGDTVALKKLNITVSGSRMDAVNNAVKPYDETAVYTTASLKAFQAALDKAREMAEDESVSDEEFAAVLNELSDAVAALELVSPLLKNDPLTDGTSLDFSKMNVGNQSTFGYGDTPAWLDAEPGTFVGYWLVEDKGAIMDFGIDYKISVNKFGFQARAGFSDRLAGVQVFGSNDRVNWEKLTVAEAAYQQAYQTVDVAEEYHDKQYRFLMFKKTTEYPDVLSGSVQNLLEIAEIRMWGTRYETGNLIESITMSCDTVDNGRIKMGDTVKVTIQGRDTLRDLKVNIHGVDAVITEGADHTYTATAVMNSADCSMGQVGLTLDYTKADGTPGETFHGTTDGSTLFLVDSDRFVNTGMLAAVLTASSGSWDGKLSPEQSAALLFDGNTDSFGDLKNQFGDYYVVDFGEGVTVSLTDVMLMPRASHPNRMNNTVIYGSNDTGHESYDEKEWVKLTPAVTGATANKWTHFGESDIADKNGYRFFQILGAENGDISEVEFYGTYHAAVQMIADQIKELPVQEALQTELTYPYLPAGYTVSVDTSSNEAVIGKDGSVCAAVNETVVTLRLLVTAPTGETALTQDISVTVKGLDSVITGIKVPARGAQTLTMPELPEGYAVTVATSEDETVVSLGEGRITTPEKDTLVKVSLQLKRESDGVTVQSEAYTVLIYGTEEAQKLDVNELAAGMTASSGGWGGNGTAEDQAKKLFDGDDSTFGDLASGNTFTVDFGEGKAVLPTKFRLKPRSGGKNNTEYLGRMNGAFVQGSADGTTWVDITAPLEGVNEFKFYDITAEDFLTCGSYRYIRITGAANGNISEAEIYGSMVEEEVPEEEPIDVMALATHMESSIDYYKNAFTREEAARRLFDGDTATYGDLAGDGDYTIDFGDKVTIMPSKFAIYPRLGDSGKPLAEHVDRLNGVKLQASNDGTSWTDITGALGGIAAKDENAVKWHELAVTVEGSYRYIRITGGKGGNMSEVRFYGEVNEAQAPEEEPIDVKAMAVHMESSVDFYKNQFTREEAAKRLFDGDTATYGDLAGDGDYTIDFGDKVTIMPSKFAIYPRLGDSGKPLAEHVDRLNGVKLQASNDGTSWTDITGALGGIAAKDENAVKWHELAVTVEGSYRYIRITGGKGGNMSEVRFYGTVNKSEAASMETSPDVNAPADENVDAENPSEPETGGGNTQTPAVQDTETGDSKEPEPPDEEAAAPKDPAASSEEADSSDIPKEPDIESSSTQDSAASNGETDSAQAPADPSEETDASQAPADPTGESGTSQEAPEAPDTEADNQESSAPQDAPQSQTGIEANPGTGSSEEENTDAASDAPEDAE